jgi:hypothetical protein
MCVCCSLSNCTTHKHVLLPLKLPPPPFLQLSLNCPWLLGKNDVSGSDASGPWTIAKFFDDYDEVRADGIFYITQGGSIRGSAISSICVCELCVLTACCCCCHTRRACVPLRCPPPPTSSWSDSWLTLTEQAPCVDGPALKT